MYAEDLKKLATNETISHLLKPLFQLVYDLRTQVGNLEKKLAESRMIRSGEKYLSPKEFAHEIGYSARAIQQWCEKGRLEAIQVGPRCAWRIPESELRQYKEDNGLSPRKAPEYVIHE